MIKEFRYCVYCSEDGKRFIADIWDATVLNANGVEKNHVDFVREKLTTFPAFRDYVSSLGMVQYDVETNELRCTVIQRFSKNRHGLDTSLVKRQVTKTVSGRVSHARPPVPLQHAVNQK